VARLVWLKDELSKSANDDSYTDDKPTNGIQVFHYHNDHLGTPNELTNHNGEVVWLADYEAWGNTAKVVWREEKLKSLQVSADELQPIRFQGQSFDTETGLHYNRFRYFDPDLGMFTTRDPIGLMGGNNVFQYAPNPVGWIDPFGLSSTVLGKNMGARPYDGMANHHVIPEEVMKKKEFKGMFDKLQSIGWHGDHASNGIFLPSSESYAKTLGLPGHWSNHKNYTAEIIKDVKKLNNLFNKGVLSEIKLALGIKEIQDKARIGLEKGKFKTHPCTGRLI